MSKYYLISLLFLACIEISSNDIKHPSKEALTGFLSFIDDKIPSNSLVGSFLYDDNKRFGKDIEKLKLNQKELYYGLHRNWSENQRKLIQKKLNNYIGEVEKNFFDISEYLKTKAHQIDSTYSVDHAFYSVFNSATQVISWYDNKYITYRLRRILLPNGDSQRPVIGVVSQREPSPCIDAMKVIDSFILPSWNLIAQFLKQSQFKKIVDQHDQVFKLTMRAQDLVAINKQLKK